jgi:hypothetical protein
VEISLTNGSKLALSPPSVSSARPSKNRKNKLEAESFSSHESRILKIIPVE